MPHGVAVPPHLFRVGPTGRVLGMASQSLVKATTHDVAVPLLGPVLQSRLHCTRLCLQLASATSVRPVLALTERDEKGSAVQSLFITIRVHRAAMFAIGLRRRPLRVSRSGLRMAEAPPDGAEPGALEACRVPDQGAAVSSGGYVAQRQPPPPGIRTLQGGGRGGGGK